jgi:hypothetical protein
MVATHLFFHFEMRARRSISFSASLHSEASTSSSVHSIPSVPEYEDTDPQDDEGVALDAAELSSDSDSDSSSPASRLLSHRPMGSPQQNPVPSVLSPPRQHLISTVSNFQNDTDIPRQSLATARSAAKPPPQPSRTCGALLFCLNIIFLILNVMDTENPLPITLTTVFNRLNVKDDFLPFRSQQ